MVDDSVLAGYVVFHADDLLRAARLLLRNGAVRAKLPAGAGGLGQQVITDEHELVECGCDRVVPAPVLASYRHACVDARSLSYRVIADADHALSDAQPQRLRLDPRALAGGDDAWRARSFAHQDHP